MNKWKIVVIGASAIITLGIVIFYTIKIFCYKGDIIIGSIGLLLGIIGVAITVWLGLNLYNLVERHTVDALEKRVSSIEKEYITEDQFRSNDGMAMYYHQKYAGLIDSILNSPNPEQLIFPVAIGTGFQKYIKYQKETILINRKRKYPMNFNYYISMLNICNPMRCMQLCRHYENGVNDPGSTHLRV